MPNGIPDGAPGASADGPPPAPGPRVPVLIAGAGPTGLVLALWLTRAGVPVRVVDQAAGPGTTSRALAVQARTLEFYRQLGIADAAVAGGVEMTTGHLWVRGRNAARLPLGAMGAGLSPFPYLLVFPQDLHERMLVDALARAGVHVEREVTLAGLDATADGVRARLRAADGTERTCDADYLAGCDGAHSTVREVLGVDFAGGTYTGLFFVADLDAEGPAVDGDLHAALDEDDFLLVFPMREPGRVRLVGRVRPEVLPAGADASPSALRWEDVRGRIVDRVGVRVRAVRWFSTYRVHHRVAGAFRRGRVFLLGDAAHVHSPVGGQGMNTGSATR